MRKPGLFNAFNFLSSSGQKELLTGGAIALSIRLLTILLNYVLLFILSWNVGAKGVGLFHLAIAIISISALVGNLGISTSIVRFVAAKNKDSHNTNQRLLYFQILKLVLPCSLVLGLFIFLLRETLSLWAFDTVGQSGTIAWISLSLPFLSITLINVEFFRGQKRIFLSEFFRNASFLLVVLVGILFIGIHTFNAQDPITLYLVGIVVSSVVSTVLLIQSLQRTETSDPNQFKVFLSTSIPMMITAFVQAINSRLPLILLGVFCANSDVGIYSTAFRIALITDLTASSLKAIAMPKVAELFWSNKRPELKVLMAKTAHWILGTSLPISSIMFVFPEFILSFFGDEFVAGAFVLRLLAGAQLINAASGLVGAFMNMVGDQKVFTRFISIAALFNIGIILLFAPYFGIIAAAYAALISASIWNIGGAIYIFKKYRIATFFLPTKRIASFK